MSISCAFLAIALTLQADKPFVSAAGGFEVKMPGTPKEQTQKVPSPIGDIEVHLFLIDKGQSAYFATYNDYPEQVANADPDVVLEGAANGAVQNSKGKLVLKQDVKLGNIPGKEIEFTIPLGVGKTGSGRSRIYLDKTRLYQVMVLGDSNFVGSPAGTAYLDSFKITRASSKTAPSREIMEIKTPKKASTPKKPAQNLSPTVFTSEEGRFEVKLPGKPLEQVQKAGGVDMHMVVVDQGNTAYFVSYLDSPNEKPDADAALEETVKGMMKGSKGTLVSKKNMRYRGLPGKEITYSVNLPDGKSAVGRARLIIDKARLYQVMLLSDTDLATSPAGTAFFNSFKITKPK